MESSSSPSSSSSLLYYYHIFQDHVRRNQEDHNSFDLTFNIFQHTASYDESELSNQPIIELSPSPIYQFRYSIPCHSLHRNDHLINFFQAHLSHYLPSHDTEYLSSEMISYLESLLLQPHSSNDDDSDRFCPVIMDINTVPSSYGYLREEEEEEEEDGDSEEMLNQVRDQSMEEVYMVPGTEKAMELLEKVEVFNNGKDGLGRCSICLENCNEGVSRMPCEHIYHENCIVKWLKVSHMCPLCRFKIPL